MKNVYIYCLKCPISNEIKYIGKTINPNKRRTNHKSINTKNKTNLEYWKRYLISNKLSPIFEILEICTESNWIEREKYYISINNNLLNMTNGGEGFSGCVSENHMSQRTKGKSIEDVYSLEKCIEIKEKLSKHFLGRSMGNNHHTEEYIKNQVESNSKVHLLVIDILENKEYKFINSKEASKFIKCSNSTIREGKRNGYLVKKRYLIKNLK